jgi:DNA repair photolyase
VLFPELPGKGLVGIARLASEGELLEAKRRVQYFDIETRSFIGRVSGRRLPFQWTINPYRGCEFGCKYCYARYAHEFMELRETEQFEQMIYAKQFDPRAFRRELSRIPVKDGIALGTATDPYQPAERRYEITRKILSVFAGEQGRTLSITTKSDLVARDAELLALAASRNIVHVSLTITTIDEALARLLEPYAPCPSLRIKAISTLSAAGVRVVVSHSPVMPLINDSRRNMEGVAAAAADAGASYMYGGVLFLKPCAQKAFFPFLEARFPNLLRRYRQRYENSPFLRGRYPELIAERLQQVRAKYGLTRKISDYVPDSWEPGPQLTLFD